MISALLSALTFTSPWMLVGLGALPLIWWLLRLTPPRPQTIPFPPAALLLGIKGNERTPIRSPWWLTLLRILIAAAAIAALAGPVLKPANFGGAGLAAQPLVVVVDNGWAAGSRWRTRQAFAEQLATLAEEKGQPLYLVATAGPQSPIQPLTPAEFRQRFASLAPQPYAGDRLATARQIGKDLTDQKGKLRVEWIADGVDDSGAASLGDALKDAAAPGALNVFADAAGTGALAVTMTPAPGGAFHARVFKAEPSSRVGQVTGVTSRGERLVAAPFQINGGDSTADVALDLPLDIRNQVARLELTGEASAGGVFLLDGRSQRRRVGLIASEGKEDEQPLLSSTYYLDRALSPFADLVHPRTANLDQSTTELIGAGASVIILSDVGRLLGATRDRLSVFVQKGGTLIRFAGPRLEAGGDNLLPAPLRDGGRTLGGAMTWTSPQTVARFEAGSPFEGLDVPGDVTVARQVLADPGSMPRDTMVWARLSDGTPLVTASKFGAGQLIFVHVTANPDWSTLPISGLFVDMMRKMLELSPLQTVGQTEVSATATETSPLVIQIQEAFLKPWRVLDGFGRLVDPGERVQPVQAVQADTVKVSAANPAGLYGSQSAPRAINVAGRDFKLSPLRLPSGARLSVYEETKTVALARWLFLGALLMFIADAFACAVLLGRGRPFRPHAAAAAIALLLACPMGADTVRAEGNPTPTPSDATTFALQASLETRLAYVLTGDAEADRVSQAGLAGLSKILNSRTAVEPGEPMGIDPARDELVFFPLIYWPVLPTAEPLPDTVLAKIDAYMKQGGMIIFDTKNDSAFTTTGAVTPGASSPLSQLLGKLDLPPLQRVPEDHVLTKAFYLLQSFPGRWDNGDPWVEARSDTPDALKRGVKSDGVSSIIITSNDLAAAWALDDGNRPLFAVVPGGEDQREMSYRVGVNIVMYALSGNYKADQVHVPAILERLGH